MLYVTSKYKITIISESRLLLAGIAVKNAAMKHICGSLYSMQTLLIAHMVLYTCWDR